MAWIRTLLYGRVYNAVIAALMQRIKGAEQKFEADKVEIQKQALALEEQALTRQVTAILGGQSV